MLRFFCKLTGASILLASFVSAYAQVEVVESTSTVQQAQQAAQKQAEQQQDAMAQANAELFHQLQLLQQEVMRLSGELEEQQHQLEELKQQRLDDYISLDKRLSALVSQAGNTSSSLSPDKLPETEVPSSISYSQGDAIPDDSPLLAKPQADKKDYKAAHDLIKDRKFDEAKSAFDVFLVEHPDSQYAANAYYWLGELHIIDGDYTEAKKAFSMVLDNYPSHNKYPEAKYKLATVNYELGEKTLAKKQLEELIQDYSDIAVSTVRKARGFIEKHYL